MTQDRKMPSREELVEILAKRHYYVCIQNKYDEDEWEEYIFENETPSTQEEFIKDAKKTLKAIIGSLPQVTYTLKGVLRSKLNYGTPIDTEDDGSELYGKLLSMGE